MNNTVIDLLDEKVIEFNSRIDNEPKFSKMIEVKPPKAVMLIPFF